MHWAMRIFRITQMMQHPIPSFWPINQQLGGSTDFFSINYIWCVATIWFLKAHVIDWGVSFREGNGSWVWVTPKSLLPWGYHSRQCMERSSSVLPSHAFLFAHWFLGRGLFVLFCFVLFNKLFEKYNTFLILRSKGTSSGVFLNGGTLFLLLLLIARLHIGLWT